MPYGSGGNPHFKHSSGTHSPSVMVVTGVCGDGTTLPCEFVDGRLTSDKYLHILQQVMIPHLQTHHGNDLGRLSFQQDGARSGQKPILIIINRTFFGLCDETQNLYQKCCGLIWWNSSFCRISLTISTDVQSFKALADWDFWPFSLCCPSRLR